MKRGQLVQARLCSWWGCFQSGDLTGSSFGQRASQRFLCGPRDLRARLASGMYWEV